MVQRLTVVVVQIKSGNTSKDLLKKIGQILC